MSKFSNPFSLKNPIKQIVKEKGIVRTGSSIKGTVLKEEVPRKQMPKPKLYEKVGLVEPIREERQIRIPEQLRERKIQKYEVLPKENFNIGVNMNDGSPMSKLGCGGKGCVRKRGNEWVILNNKKAGYPVWRSGFKSEADAKKMLSAYHANS